MDEKDLEAVVTRSTVKFPRALSLTGTLGLLDALGHVLQARIIHDVGYRRDRREISSLSINGTIIISDNLFEGVSNSFKSYPYDGLHGDKIKGFKFVNMPGYTLSDYSKDVVALWDRVNKFVKDFRSR